MCDFLRAKGTRTVEGPESRLDERYSSDTSLIMPAVSRNEQIIYSNLPCLIALGTKASTSENKCIFALFTYCKQMMPLLQLTNIPCLSDLLDTNVQTIGRCKTKRLNHVQHNLISIVGDIWVFSYQGEPLHCQRKSKNSLYDGFPHIKESSIFRVPCDVTCISSDILLKSSVCTDQNGLIRSASGNIFERLTSTPWPLKNMNNHLISTHRLLVKNSIRNALDQLKDNRLTPIAIIKDFGTFILAAFLLLLLLIILFFIKWMKHLVTERMEALERDLDDFIHLNV